MMQLFRTISVILCAVLLTSCASRYPVAKPAPPLEVVSDAQANSYEQQYLRELDAIQASIKQNMAKLVYVQPKNIKKACKLLSNSYITSQTDYSLTWDGDCKDGYAHGLGREIETTLLTNFQQIGYYNRGEAVDYCVKFHPLNNSVISGECPSAQKQKTHVVWTSAINDHGNFNLAWTYGLFTYDGTPAKVINSSKFNSMVQYRLVYPNFEQVLGMDNNSKQYPLWYAMVDAKLKHKVGYAFNKDTYGITRAYQAIDANNSKQVVLPQSFYNKVNDLYKDINAHGDLAIAAQQKADIIRNKYLKKICKNSVRVNYMDNAEYKEICNYDANIQARINAQQTLIAQQKQASLQQQNQQRLITAQENQAYAAQRAADAAERANKLAQKREINQALQNFSKGIQESNMRNQMFLNSFTPKRFDVYLH